MRKDMRNKVQLKIENMIKNEIERARKPKPIVQ